LSRKVFWVCGGTVRNESILQKSVLGGIVEGTEAFSTLLISLM
jgi:hypothetical protein